MKVLLVSATEAEIQIFSELIERFEPAVPWEIQICICGVGMVPAALNLGLTLSRIRPDLVLNAGIAGAIDKTLMPGELVWVNEDSFYGFGADSPQGFISAFEMGLISADEFPFQGGKLKASLLPLPLQNQPIRSVKGITVQTVHGDEAGIKKLKAIDHTASVESMEGAAILYAAARMGVPAIQLRAISNYVEVRDKSKWDIPLAIRNLNQFLHSVFVNP